MSFLVYKLAALCSVEQITPARIHLDYYVNSLWSVLVGWLIAPFFTLILYLASNVQTSTPLHLLIFMNMATFAFKDVHLFPVYCSF